MPLAAVVKVSGCSAPAQSTVNKSLGSVIIPNLKALRAVLRSEPAAPHQFTCVCRTGKELVPFINYQVIIYK